MDEKSKHEKVGVIYADKFIRFILLHLKTRPCWGVSLQGRSINDPTPGVDDSYQLGFLLEPFEKKRKPFLTVHFFVSAFEKRFLPVKF